MARHESSPISAALLAQKPIIAARRWANTMGMGFRMTSIAAELAKKAGQKANARKVSGELLDQRYRQIGIPAVAAAARYHGAAKNPAYAPAAAHGHESAGDAA
jgi:hypothetical protein